MLYYLLKYPIYFGLLVYFRKVYYSGRENIPKDHALIFGCNHPGAFLDPVLLGAYLPFTFNFILRGDVFVNPFVSWLLRQIRTIPVYRFRDGFGALRRNRETFSEAHQVLEKGKNPLIIMSEGWMPVRKQLLPIQRGTARLAFDVWEKTGKENIAIMPVGINYTDRDDFRSTAMLRIGEPLFLKDYIHLGDSRTGIAAMTRDLEDRLKQMVVHFDSEAEEAWGNILLTLQRNEWPIRSFPILDPDPGPLEREVSLAKAIHELSPDKRELVQSRIRKYVEALQKSGLTDFGFAQAEGKHRMSLLFLILGFFPAMLGWCIWIIPARVTRWLTIRTVREPEYFFAAFQAGIGILLFPLLWIMSLAGACLWGGWAGLIFVLLWPLLGYFFLFYSEKIGDWKEIRQAQMADPSILNQLRERREKIFSGARK